MPELPEVETVKRFLEVAVLNQKIISLDILTPKSFDGDPKFVEGQKITKFTRHGKQLSVHLSNNLILLFHLKMTGQLIYQSQSRTVLGHPTKDSLSQNLPNKSTRVIFHFSDKSILFFNDQRKFGWIKIFTKDSLTQFQHHLGIDVLDPKFIFNYFYLALQRTRAPIKSVLLDQSVFAGIGNIYANDALFLAKIHPKNPANQIQRTRALALHKSVLLVINQSILAGGSTAKDNKYVRPDGSPGENQFQFRVYQRAGESCLVCNAKIERFTLGGRGTFFCPSCQKMR
ncbi:MAG: bifunctional DNA-formamidopyrimidine glycosylase/DNA-(apurinic or apyrimidinic site) lyase [Candidatus Shapirobacteria bacterium]